MGTVPVRVVVAGPVASVELLLDGKPAGVLAGPAWSGDLDLGIQIAPHELAARALGADHQELARTRQWLNLPRPPAEVEVVLERERGGQVRKARFSWESVTGKSPSSIRASFNGISLPVSKDHSLEVPAYDPEQVHLLTVEVDFVDELRARKDVVIGGRTGEHAETELTAIPIRVLGGASDPTVASLRGRLTSHDRPLDVAAVERGSGILLVVRDSQALRGLGRWAWFSTPDAFRWDFRLDKTAAVRFVWPRPAAHRADARIVELFPVSHELDPKVGGLRWILTRYDNPAPEPLAPRFADAVAVAGLNASGTFRRRAVLLVREGAAADDSQYSPEMAREFLAKLQVPLFVWSMGPAFASTPWTEAIDASSESALRDSFKKIKRELDAQRIVWVEGKILPQDVSLSADATAQGFELVQ